MCQVKTLGPQVEWIVRSHIGCRGERIIVYKGVETVSIDTSY